MTSASTNASEVASPAAPQLPSRETKPKTSKSPLTKIAEVAESTTESKSFHSQSESSANPPQVNAGQTETELSSISELSEQPKTNANVNVKPVVRKDER